MASFASKFVPIPAPVFYAIAFGIGLALDSAAGWRLEPILALRILGWMLLMLGAVIGPGSAITFALRRTTLNPAGEPARLITGGTYSATRNPMYLGLAIAYVGLALVLRRIGPLIVLPLPLLFLNFVVIPFEEERLRSRFGASFVSYCGRVRRWV